MKSNLFKTKGITLIELVIAISLLAIISLLTGGILTSTFDIRKMVFEKEEMYHLVRLAMMRITSEISGAYIKPSKDKSYTIFVGKDSGELDSITFDTFSHYKLLADAKESDQNEITYYTDDSKDGHKRLMKKEAVMITEEEEEQGESFTLIKNIKKFNLRYCDGKTSEWRNDWDSTKIEYKDRLPLAVEIAMILGSAEEEKEEEEEEIEFKNVAIVEWEFRKKIEGNIEMKGCKLDE